MLLAGNPVTWAKTWLRLKVQIVKRPDDLHTFTVLPRRWVVERTFLWITRHRRTVRDYERLAAHHETYLYWSMIIVMTRRLARQPAAAKPQPHEFSSRLKISEIQNMRCCVHKLPDRQALRDSLG